MRARRVPAVAAGCALAIAVAVLTAPAEASAERTFSYDTPVLETSPWPAMRRDRRNTGSSPLRARYHPGTHPWRFRTGKGIFSTPVLDGAEDPACLLYTLSGADRSEVSVQASVPAAGWERREVPIERVSDERFLFRLHPERELADDLFTFEHHFSQQVQIDLLACWKGVPPSPRRVPW